MMPVAAKNTMLDAAGSAEKHHSYDQFYSKEEKKVAAITPLIQRVNKNHGKPPKFSDILYDERFISSLPKKTTLEEIIYAMCGVEPQAKISSTLLGPGDDFTNTTNNLQ